MPYANYKEHLASNRKRQRTARGAANHARAVQVYRERNRIKHAAQNAISKAIYRGKLVPWPCCAMPNCDETKVEAHHAHYDLKLDVTWLCGPCHRFTHNMV